MDPVSPASASENVARNQLEDISESVESALRHRDPKNPASEHRLKKLLRHKADAEKSLGEAVHENMTLPPRQVGRLSATNGP